MTDELKPCPFCGAGSNEIKDMGKYWLGSRWSEPVAVEVQHWCVKQAGQPSPRKLIFVGKDRYSAIKAWNTRIEKQ